MLLLICATKHFRKLTHSLFEHQIFNLFSRKLSQQRVNPPTILNPHAHTLPHKLNVCDNLTAYATPITDSTNKKLRVTDKNQVDFACKPSAEDQIDYRTLLCVLFSFSTNLTDGANDHNIECVPITDTLTKIRVYDRHHVPHPQREILCYPITNLTRPLDLFGAFPKSVQTFLPANPPAPPNRYSSKTNNTLRMFSDIQNVDIDVVDNVPQPPPLPIDTGTIILRKSRLPETIRSKSANSVLCTYTSSNMASLKEEKNYTNHSRVQRKHVTARVSSVSPVGRLSKPDQRKASASPIAFGRSYSKERMFAEEKKKMEESMPLCRKSFTASTSILRNPDLKSPDEVKRAVQTTFRMPSSSEKIVASKSLRKTSAGGTVRTSALSYSANRTEKGPTKMAEKSLRLTLAVTPKGGRPSTTTLRTTTTDSSRYGKTMSSTSSQLRSSSAAAKIAANKIKRTAAKTNSNLSLARTSSTYSIDSTNSKMKSGSKSITTMSRSVSKDLSTITGRPSTTVKTKRSLSKDKLNGAQKKREPMSRGAEPKAKINSRRIETKKTVKTESANNSRQAVSETINRSSRSDAFFQNLFLRDIESPTPSTVSCLSRNTYVQEKARLWDSLAEAHNEVALPKYQSAYLANKRAVTESKFKAMEHEHKLRQSRSASPNRIFRPRSLFYDRISKFDSFYQLSDDDEEFGNASETEATKYRSRSEPSSKLYFTVASRPRSPQVIQGSQRNKAVTAEKTTRSLTPTAEIRSPSCRRIQSFRVAQKSDQVRARSLGVASDNRCQSLDSRQLARSASVDANCYENHMAQCSHRRSDRFSELNQFYSNLERVGQLERATSSTDLRPIRKEGDIIDFDIWKQVRQHEKNEKELNSLIGKLKREEKEKDLFFRPKYVEDAKWHRSEDSGLRIKEKSVEDLKEQFLEKSLADRHADVVVSKDNYKPLWRGSSVLDLASNMVVKYNQPPGVHRTDSASSTSMAKSLTEKRLGLSQKLISTLSHEQVNKIKNQLSEIYGNNFGAATKKTAKDDENAEQYIINVQSESQPNTRPLTVRSNSLVMQHELLAPVLQKQQTRLMENYKAESTGTVFEPRYSRSADRATEMIRREQAHITEAEKRTIFHNISKEIQNKINEKRQKSMAPIVTPKETRGAIASDNARSTMQPESLPPPLPIVSLEYSGTTKITHKPSNNSMKFEAKLEKTVKRDTTNQPHSIIYLPAPPPPPPIPFRGTSITCESETVSSEASKQTVIYKEPDDRIKEKIEYFETKQEESPPETTIYHAREYSSPDEDEVMKIIEDKIKSKTSESKCDEKKCSSLGLSSSASDFKELFGEREIRKIYEPSTEVVVRPPSPRRNPFLNTASETTSCESAFRSRSVSPQFESKNFKTYFNLVRTGDVRKMKDKFESLTYRPQRSFDAMPPRRIQSDPELNKIKRLPSPPKTIVRNHEAGDVSWITHKFEVKNSAARGRSRTRRIISPIPKIPFKKDDRFMPHIDIISKTASLKQELKTVSPIPRPPPSTVWTGEVNKLRHKFESSNRLSLLGQMYTSSPDIRELKDISSYLSGSWIAHKYPKARDNARSPVCPEKGPISDRIPRRQLSRPNSTSPPRSKRNTVPSILKPFYDIFANQDYDPAKHRPTHRYVPDKRIEAEFLWRRLQRNAAGCYRKPTVKFEGCSL